MEVLVPSNQSLMITQELFTLLSRMLQESSLVGVTASVVMYVPLIHESLMDPLLICRLVDVHLCHG